MDGVYLGVMYENGLFPQVLIFGIRLHHFLQPLRKTFLHLACGRPCKGDDQQPVEIGRMFLIGDQRNDPFDKDCGLARACRSAYQQIFTPGIYYLFLFI